MSDAPTPTIQSEPAPPAVPSRSNRIGLVAIILAGVGFILAVIPPTAFIAWILLLPAFILSIVGLTRKGKSKGTSIAAMVLSVVGWIIAIIVALVVAAAGVVSDDNSTTVTKGSGSTSSHSTKQAGIGDTVTNHDGVAFTVNSVTCGLTSAPDDIYGTDKPTGQFCKVKFTVKNGSNTSIDLSSDSLTGHIGKASFDADDKTDRYGSETYLKSLNPGLSIPCTFYVDIPKGEKLTSLELGTAYSFGVGNVTVHVG